MCQPRPASFPVRLASCSCACMKIEAAPVAFTNPGRDLLPRLTGTGAGFSSPPFAIPEDTMPRLIALMALLFSLTLTQEAFAVEKQYLTLELESGPVKIELLPEIAPKHVERIVTLAEQGAYDNIAFHRVIEGFMAQTGDVRHGQIGEGGEVSSRAGTGGSD